jgi:hypothetical protein
MIDDSKKDDARPKGGGLPDCEMFCIHSYAGSSGPPCGWRGKLSAVTRDPRTGERRCPRCGRTTLLEILPPS